MCFIPPRQCPPSPPLPLQEKSRRKLWVRPAVRALKRGGAQDVISLWFAGPGQLTLLALHVKMLTQLLPWRLQVLESGVKPTSSAAAEEHEPNVRTHSFRLEYGVNKCSAVL